MTETYRVEKELLGSTPRKVTPKPSLREDAFSWSLVLGLLFLLGLLLFVEACGETFNIFKGVSAPAVVMGREKVTRDDTSFWRVDYDYQYHEITYTGSTYISKQDYDSVEMGMPLVVRVLPSAPDHFAALQGFGKDQGEYFVLVWIGVLAWLASMAAMFWWTYVSASNPRRLIANGVLAEALVTEKETVLGGEAPSYRLTYTFNPTGRETVSGHNSVTREQYDALSVGDHLTVFHNAKQPHIHLIYQFASYRAIGRGEA